MKIQNTLLIEIIINLFLMKIDLKDLGSRCSLVLTWNKHHPEGRICCIAGLVNEKQASIGVY
jgi:hypothetical protein